VRGGQNSYFLVRGLGRRETERDTRESGSVLLSGESSWRLRMRGIREVESQGYKITHWAFIWASCVVGLGRHTGLHDGLAYQQIIMMIYVFIWIHLPPTVLRLAPGYPNVLHVWTQLPSLLRHVHECNSLTSSSRKSAKKSHAANCSLAYTHACEGTTQARSVLSARMHAARSSNNNSKRAW
jgi:hypothetical protein